MKMGGRIPTDGLILYFDPGFENSFIKNALPITSGLVMWMDAADDNSFTYSSGTTVSQWNDKSGSGYHMTPVTNGPTRSTTLNSKSVVAFTTTQNLRNTSIDLRSSAYTVFLVGRYSSSPAERILTAIYNNWLLGTWQGWVNQYYAEGWVQYQTYFADTTWRMYMGDWSGPLTDQANFYGSGASIVANSTAASAGPWGLGMNSGEPSSSEIAEILVYNKVLSTAERRLIHTYLANKWALTSNSEGIIYDLSGRNNTGIFSGGYSFNSSNVGSIVLDGSNDCIVVNDNASILSSTAYTKIAWFYATSFWTGNNIISGGNSGQHAFWLAGANKLNAGHNSSWSTVVSNTTLSLNTWYCGAVTFSTSTGWVLYLNGIQENTSASTTAFTGNGEILVGAFSTGANVFTGRIANVLVYNRVLSAAEILQFFNTTKSRFNFL
jgi:hypothetical protein